MAEFTLEQLMRTGHVKRWQIVRVGREQTIAEHMYRVWIFTVHLCKALDAPQELAARAQAWALVHDIPEVITGDMATPMKKMIREHVPNDDPVRNIELGLSDGYRKTWSDAKQQCVINWPTAYELVKLADLLESRMFLGCEMIGNHAKAVYDEMDNIIEDHYMFLKTAYRDPEWRNIHYILNQSWVKA